MIALVSLGVLGSASRLNSTVGDESAIKMSLEEFYYLREFPPRVIDTGGVTVNQNEWDRALLTSGGVTVN